MKIRFLLLTILLLGIIPIQNSFGEPTAEILMEKTTFSYGERLFYTIEVSEVTGDLAIIHIRDEAGKGSSAIPMERTQLQTVIPSPFPFEKEVFPEGKYFIDLQYSGAQYTAEFELVDSGNIVIPFLTKQIAYSWVNNQVSAGILIDSLQKTAEESINIPIEIDR